VAELYIITLFVSELQCGVFHLRLLFYRCYTCYYSLYINELEQRFNFLSVFVSVSPRGQFVCVSVGSVVVLKFFCVFVFYEYTVQYTMSTKTVLLLLHKNI